MNKLFCALLTISLLCCAFPAFSLQQGQHYNWYEVFVYSFKDSDGDGIGDLRGLISKLDYIQDMGFTAMWLMPLMPSPSYHKYNVTDYYGIDPAYGSMEDMRALVAACRERNMAVIVDMPFNHTSTLHPWFLEAVDAIKLGRLDAPVVDYYNFQQEPAANFAKVLGSDWYYEEQFAGGGMPDLNLDNREVRAEIASILSFWLKDVGVDGFRLDAVTSYYTGDDQKNIKFLRFVKDTCEAIKPGSFLVGECWKNLSQIAQYYQSGIDSFFLFPASQAEGYIASVMRARRPAQAYAEHLGKVHQAIPEGVLTPFLSNHDTGRTVGLVQGRQAPQRVKFAHALLSLMGGYAFVYYGEELGMAGSGADPNKRLGMPWNDTDITRQPPGVTKAEYPFANVEAQQQDPLSILNYMKTLNRQRLQMPAVALGSTEFVEVTADTLVMVRAYQGQDIHIAVNFSAKETREIRLEGGFEPLFFLDVGEEASSLAEARGNTLLVLAPYGIAYLQGVKR